jgi:hypothetical protein
MTRKQPGVHDLNEKTSMTRKEVIELVMNIRRQEDERYEAPGPGPTPEPTPSPYIQAIAQPLDVKRDDGAPNGAINHNDALAGKTLSGAQTVAATNIKTEQHGASASASGTHNDDKRPCRDDDDDGDDDRSRRNDSNKEKAADHIVRGRRGGPPGGGGGGPPGGGPNGNPDDQQDDGYLPPRRPRHTQPGDSETEITDRRRAKGETALKLPPFPKSAAELDGYQFSVKKFIALASGRHHRRMPLREQGIPANWNVCRENVEALITRSLLPHWRRATITWHYVAFCDVKDAQVETTTRCATEDKACGVSTPSLPCHAWLTTD